MFAELDQHIFPSEVKVLVADRSTGDLQVTENGKEVNVNEVLQVAQSTDYSPTLLEKSCFNEVRLTERQGRVSSNNCLAR